MSRRERRLEEKENQEKTKRARGKGTCWSGGGVLGARDTDPGGDGLPVLVSSGDDE